MMADEDGEKYLDVVKGTVRPRRGARKTKRGPYSASMARMRRQFQYVTAAMNRMHGELADVTADDLYVFLLRAQNVMDRYSYKKTSDNLPDLHIVRNELDMYVEPVVEEQDVYRDLLQ